MVFGTLRYTFKCNQNLQSYDIILNLKENSRDFGLKKLILLMIEN